MSDPGDRGRDGKFVAGNKAARKQDALPTSELGRAINRVLPRIDPERREFSELLGLIGGRVVEQALNGNIEAAKLVLDRFSPAPRGPRVRIRGLPKPSEAPLQFLDKLAAEVAAGRLGIDDAAKLSRLVAPLVVDAELRKLMSDVEELRRRVGARRDRRGHGKCEVVPLR